MAETTFDENNPRREDEASRKDYESNGVGAAFSFTIKTQGNMYWNEVFAVDFSIWL